MQTQGKQYNFKLSTLKVELRLWDLIAMYWFIEGNRKCLSAQCDVINWKEKCTKHNSFILKAIILSKYKK